MPASTPPGRRAAASLVSPPSCRSPITSGGHRSSRRGDVVTPSQRTRAESTDPPHAMSDPATIPAEPEISTITLAELSVGPLVATTRKEQAARQAHLQRAEADFDPLPFDANAARAFGQVAASLRRAGRKATARAYDAMIAAIAISNELPLYTCNPARLQRHRWPDRRQRPDAESRPLTDQNGPRARVGHRRARRRGRLGRLSVRVVEQRPPVRPRRQLPLLGALFGCGHGVGWGRHHLEVPRGRGRQRRRAVDLRAVGRGEHPRLHRLRLLDRPRAVCPVGSRSRRAGARSRRVHHGQPSRVRAREPRRFGRRRGRWSAAGPRRLHVPEALPLGQQRLVGHLRRLVRASFPSQSGS